jgi:PAS domain S-box-containing protein
MNNPLSVFKLNKTLIRNLTLITAGLMPYIKTGINGQLLTQMACIGMAAVILIYAFLNRNRRRYSQSTLYIITAFMIIAAFSLTLSGNRDAGFFWLLFVLPANKIISARNTRVAAMTTLITIAYLVLSLISSCISGKTLTLSTETIYTYIIQPLILVSALWISNFTHKDWNIKDSSFRFPSFFLAPFSHDESEDKESGLFDFLKSLEEGIFIADREGTIINSSVQFASFFDTTPDDLAGFSIFDRYALPHSHQIKAFNLIKKNMDGLPSGPDEFVFEVKNGKRLRLLIMTMPIIIDGNPAVIGITKPLQRNRGRLLPYNKTKDKFQTLTENSTDIIIRFDRQLRHIYANYAITGLTGMAVENFLGKTCHETKYPRTILDTLEEKVEKVFETGEPIETEFYHDWGTGEVYFDLRLIPEKDINGRVETVLSTARDITPLKKAHKTIRTLTQEIIRAQELERNRIALDLHDNVAQNLASLKIACDTIFDNEPNISEGTRQKFREFSSLIRTGINSIRELAYNLRPPGLDQLGIIKTLSQLCSEFTAAYKIKTDFQSWGIDSLKLSNDTQINLYRLLQEGLSNVKKHSGADFVNIKLVSSHPNIIMRIEDNGKGFNVDRRSEEAVKEKRMGLQGMHERARMLGGRMKIISRPSEGTRVIIEVPAAIDSDIQKNSIRFSDEDDLIS